eukprot:TRINITY_DN79951_c0_g1_i1.p1 TRINITY_DN79951_c0_g1~~TRINITY_DN79951_c0_g1_i1.p1  ORF type:complete len:518 (-),score=79.47 TRINITY_DN79951_c0_g1_i1:49-1554(-)
MRKNKCMRAGKSLPITLGLDLGTSCTRVGVWRDGDVFIVPSASGSLSTPSCVAFMSCTSPVVGEGAVEQAADNLENTIFAPQSLLGASYDSPWAQKRLAAGPPFIERGENGSALFSVFDRGKQRLVTPEDVVSILLDELRRQVENFLEVRVKGVVVTVPSQFGRVQRQALEKACSQSSLPVIAILKAPTASAIAFSVTNRSSSKRDVLVVDLGKTTCDFCLMTLDSMCIVERAVGSECVDMDGALVAFCVSDVKHRFGADISRKWHSLFKLRCSCESAKVKLSQWTHAKIQVDELFDGEDYSMAISRAYFEEFCTRDLDSLLDTFDLCIANCGLDRDAVEVILVGASSRIPRFRMLIRDFFRGRAPHEVLRPEHAAVLGASVYAIAMDSNHGSSLQDPKPTPKPLHQEDSEGSDDANFIVDLDLDRPALSQTPVNFFKGLELQEITPWAMLDGTEQKSNVDSFQLADMEDVPVNETFGLSRLPKGQQIRFASGGHHSSHFL